MTETLARITAGMLLVLATPLACLGQNQAQLLVDALRSRGDAVTTFQADVTITDTYEGPDSKAYAQALRGHIAWYQKNGKRLPFLLETRAKDAERPLPSQVTHCRYFIRHPGILRLEYYGRGAEKSKYEIAHVFSGERWQSYAPVTANREAGKKFGYQHDLIIEEKGDFSKVSAVARSPHAHKLNS